MDAQRRHALIAVVVIVLLIAVVVAVNVLGDGYEPPKYSSTSTDIA